MSRSSSSAAAAPSPSDVDPFAAFYANLVEVHHALAGSLSAVAAAAAAPLERLVMQAQASGAFMEGHHGMEENILFPGLRRLGRLRSTDVAFLDGCERDHRVIHALCGRLMAEVAAPHPRAGEITVVAKELHTTFTLHVREEELGLAPPRFATMIDEAGLAAIGAEIDESRRRHQRR